MCHEGRSVGFTVERGSGDVGYLHRGSEQMPYTGTISVLASRGPRAPVNISCAFSDSRKEKKSQVSDGGNLKLREKSRDGTNSTEKRVNWGNEPLKHSSHC